VPSTSMWLPFFNWLVLIKVQASRRDVGSVASSGEPATSAW
jgi:hypothetical protein